MFEIGDQVCLRSGSEPMTVVFTETDEFHRPLFGDVPVVGLRWMDRYGKMNHATLPCEALEEYQPDD